MAAYGIPEADIARVLGVSKPTLRKHCGTELDTGWKGGRAARHALCRKPARCRPAADSILCYPLFLGDGSCVGTLCIPDTRPCELDERGLSLLPSTGEMAMIEPERPSTPTAPGAEAGGEVRHYSLIVFQNGLARSILRGPRGRQIAGNPRTR
jgi:hypothetical protein